MESEMKCNVTKTRTHKMPEGLELEIAHHPLTMRQVVNLIIAAERLKGSPLETVLSTEFRDENLLNIMLDSIVEEQVVFECNSVPPSVQFSKTDELQYSVSDSEKRSLVLVRDSMELHAVMLQGGTDSCKVHLNMSTYLDRQPHAEARTVALGIKDTNFYLSCIQYGDKPTLHLEEVDDKNSLSRISSDSDMVRFLFYKQDTGVNLTTLVSVPFHDWCISTEAENNKPVKLCPNSDDCHRIFNIRQLKPSDVVECCCASSGQV